MEDDAPIIDASDFIRDLEKEERFQALIFDKTLGPNSDGEDSDEEDGEDFSEKCLNDSVTDLSYKTSETTTTTKKTPDH